MSLAFKIASKDATAIARRLSIDKPRFGFVVSVASWPVAGGACSPAGGGAALPAGGVGGVVFLFLLFMRSVCLSKLICLGRRNE